MIATAGSTLTAKRLRGKKTFLHRKKKAGRQPSKNEHQTHEIYRTLFDPQLGHAVT